MRACRRPAARHPQRRATAVASLVAATALSSAPAFSGVFNPQLFTLDNGLRVVLIENQATLAVGHVIYYGVGSADETPGQSGLAHLFEHLQLRGTPSHPDREFSRLIARVGGEENASTSSDFTSYYQITAAEHLPQLMAMEADRMTNTLLTPEVIDTERLVVYEEFNTRIGNNPSVWLGVEATAALFVNGSYAIGFNSTGAIAGSLLTWQLLGLPRNYADIRPDLVNAVTPEIAVETARRWWNMDDMLMVVVGQPVGITPTRVAGEEIKAMFQLLAE
jgi:predicted Zn-dependent peptidase